MTIVIIDDDEDVAATMAEALRRHGLGEVHVAHTGAAGLALAKERGVEMVVCDVVLPDVSGYEVCRELRESPATSTLGIIQISGLATATEQRLKAFEAGADLFLPRPIPSAELVANVGALLRRKRRLAQLEANAVGILDDVERLFRLGLSVMEVVNGLKMPLSVVYAAVTILKRQKAGERVVRALERASAEMTEVLDSLVLPRPDDAEPAHDGDGVPVLLKDDTSQCDLNSVIKGRLLIGTAEPFVRDHVRLEVVLAAGLPPLAAARGPVTTLVGQILALAIGSHQRFLGTDLALSVRTAATADAVTLRVVCSGNGTWPVDPHAAAIDRAVGEPQGGAQPGGAKGRPAIPFFHALAQPQEIARTLRGRVDASWEDGSLTFVVTLPIR